MSESSQDWFHTSVFSIRSMRSTIWTVTISFLWLLIISLISFILQSPLHPINALVTTLNLISPSSMFHLFIFVSTILWSSVKHSQSFSLTPSVFHSWSKLLGTSFQSTIASSMAQFSMQSTVMAWCLIKLVWPDYSSLFSSCAENDENESWCVSHDQLFLLGCGAVTGLYLGVRYHFYSDSCISFPIIYMETTTQIKQQVKPLLISTLKQAIQILKYYYIFYLSASLIFSSSIHISPFSTSLFVAAMSVTTLILVTNETKLKVFSIFLTGPLPSVPLEQILSSLSPSTPLLHHLSLQSLARLTATSSSVRSSIFSLSQPGGHPHNWNTVSQSCLATVDSISSSITSLTSPKPIAPAAPVPKPQPQQISSPNMRRLAPSFGAKMEEVPVPATASPAKQMISSITSVLDKFKNQPGVAWLFRVEPDAGIRAIFCKSQAAIWSVDILSYLVANSISEDKFGVVQKELAIILNSLLSLDQKISVYRKVGGAFEKDVKLRLELKAAVKAGLYRIAIQFGEHIQAIPLDRENSNKMMSYQKLMEA